MNGSPNTRAVRWPVIVVIGLFVLITLVFVVAFVTTTESETASAPEATADLTADTYMDKVTVLLQNANPENGASLIEQYGCVACHRLGVVSKVAPSFEGIAERAASRRLPLTAAAYIYESITHPTAYVVDGFQPAMPQNFSQRLTDRELGDIIAYLLTPGAH
ncbi:MAG: cytochrome c [Chloroflexota bacterium]